MQSFVKEHTPANANQALWEKGDFTQVAALMRQAGDDFVESLAIAAPIRVLDLGCGDGTTALPLARRGAEVVGIDIAENLVRAGNRRAAEAGLTRLAFYHGDACDLRGVNNDSFDLIVSMFGAMFAPKPFDVAREMVRVARPGSRIVMGNWIPSDPTSFISDVLTISAAFTPPPPEGFVSPITWGLETHVVERFGKAGVPAAKIEMRKDTFCFISPDKSPADVIEAFRRFYGPTMNAFAAAEAKGEAEMLRTKLVDAAATHNVATAGTRIPATFLRVTVSV